MTGEPVNQSFLHTDTAGLCNCYVLDGPAQVEFCNNQNWTYVCVCVCVCVWERESAWIRIKTHWNMRGRSTTTPLPVLSPNSILPPPSSRRAFISARKNSACLKKMLRISSFILCTFEMACVGECLYSHLILWHHSHTVSVPTPVLGNKWQYSKNYMLIVSILWSLGRRSICSVSATFGFANRLCGILPPWWL